MDLKCSYFTASMIAYAPPLLRPTPLVYLPPARAHPQSTAPRAGYTTHHTNLNLDEFTSGVLHSAVLEELKPSSTYFYRVGDAELGLSDVRNFTTPGALGTERPLVLGILADLGQTNDSRYIVWLFVPVCTCKSTQHGVSSRLVVVLRVRVLL